MVPAKMDPGLERIKHAKTTAEKAMKVNSNRNLDPYENLMFEWQCINEIKRVILTMFGFFHILASEDIYHPRSVPCNTRKSSQSRLGGEILQAAHGPSQKICPKQEKKSIN